MNDNIYKENLKDSMGNRPYIVFKNVNHDLKNYRAFLKDIEAKLKELSVLPVKLQRVNRKWGSMEKDSDNEFLKYEIRDDNEQIEAIEKLLFDTEVKHLYITRIRQKGEKHSDNRLVIQDRNGEERQLYFDEDLKKEVTLYVRQDEYQISKQIQAIERLQNKPLREHLPLLKLFKDPRDERLDDVDCYYYDESILRDEGDWSVLTDETRNGTTEQREFVKKALTTADFALLEGPPGSGKTTSIIELVIQLCMLGKRILLVSSTHVAVDNVLKRILTSYEDKCQDVVAPVRIANDKGQIRYKEVEAYRLQELVVTKAKQMKIHLQNSPNRTESQEVLLKALKKESYPRFFETSILEASNLVCGTMIGILQHPQIRRSTIDTPFDVMIVDEASKVTFQEFLVPALYAKKWILVGDVQQLSPYVEGEYVELALSKLLEEKEKKHLQIVFPVWKASQYTPKRVAQNYLKILLSNDFEESKAKEVFGKDLEVFSLNGHFSETPDEILALNAADIVLARNNKKNRDILNRCVYVKAEVFDGVLHGEFQRVQAYYSNTSFNRPAKDIDTWERELAHRLSQHYAFRASPELGEHLKKDIDFLTSYNKVVNAKFERTLKEEIERIKRITMPSILELLQNGLGETLHQGRKLDRILYDGFPAKAKKYKFTSLSYQHRMNDLIAQTSRNHFYEGNLETANTVIDRINPLGTYKQGEDAVIWVTNTEKIKYDRLKKRRLNSNLKEAKQMIGELKDFLEWSKGAPPKEKNEPFEVAVLCFYRDQESLMRRELQRLFRQETIHRYKPIKNFDFGSVKVVLCTVDRFQGDEADMVLLSFTKASYNAFYKSPNRLNVALTRAKYKLVLFGNHKFFGDKNISKALTGLAQFDVRKSSARTTHSKRIAKNRRI